MINPQKIEAITRQIQELLPQSVREAGQGFDRKIKEILQAQLSRLEVVSREEFDIQAQVLARTREKLHALEMRVEQLEKQIQNIE